LKFRVGTVKTCPVRHGQLCIFAVAQEFADFLALRRVLGFDEFVGHGGIVEDDDLARRRAVRDALIAQRVAVYCLAGDVLLDYTRVFHHVADSEPVRLDDFPGGEHFHFKRHGHLLERSLGFGKALL
jgi:hypothetical protein